MIFKQLFDHDTSTYTYLIASAPGREAIIIDPVKGNKEIYTKLLNELDVKLAYTLDTHVHADHITASGDLREETGSIYVMGEHTNAHCVSLKVKEGEMINVDGLKFQTIYTPGHTNDSYSFVLDNQVFTGDTLLIRGTGRTDFQNGNSIEQYDSIFNKLLKLPDETIVYPGHDYHGHTSSSIWEERAFNPRLQVKSAEAYADLMANLNLPLPRYIDVAVPANIKCGIDES
ncbi:MAG: MBL fold metallo-hydrolase [Francisellaceae bacterium]|jgi:sulfur dioxygenase|nr:MBL fold metallo-hydrolase [Francisellaceae bacterium]